MKKIKFLVDVGDKYTKVNYVKGQEVEFEDARADEILSAKQSNNQPYATEVKKETIIETAQKKLKTEKAVKKTKKVSK